MSTTVKRLRDVEAHLVNAAVEGTTSQTIELLREAASEITRYRAMLRVVREHLAKHSNNERSALVVAIDETLRGGK